LAAYSSANRAVDIASRLTRVEQALSALVASKRWEKVATVQHAGAGGEKHVATAPANEEDANETEPVQQEVRNVPRELQ